jgi:hypothetical protein
MVTEQTIEVFVNSGIPVDVFLGTDSDRALEAPETALPEDYPGFEIAALTNGKRVLYKGTDDYHYIMEYYVMQTFPGERVVGTWKHEAIDGEQGWRFYEPKGVGA